MSERQERFPALLERLRPECERIIAQYEDRRSALLPLMHLFQEHEGFVSPEAMGATAEMLGVTPAVVESTVSFYTLLYRRPVGKYMVHVCRGLACTINGAEDVMQAFRQRLGIGNLETTPDGLISYEEVECLAACDRATCGQVNLEFVYDLDDKQIEDMIAAMRAGTYAVAARAQTDEPVRTWNLSRVGEVARGKRSAGAVGTESPDNAGGLGDRPGIIMLDRIVERGLSFHGATRERAIREARDVVTVIEAEEANTHAGH